jgi:hypothetical protein
MVAIGKDGARITQAHVADCITENLRHLRHGLLRGAVHAELERIHLGALPQLARERADLVELARQQTTRAAVVGKPPLRPRLVIALLVPLARASLRPATMSLSGRLLPSFALLDVCADCFTLFSSWLNWPTPAAADEPAAITTAAPSRPRSIGGRTLTFSGRRDFECTPAARSNRDVAYHRY